MGVSVRPYSIAVMSPVFRLFLWIRAYTITILLFKPALCFIRFRFSIGIKGGRMAGNWLTSRTGTQSSYKFIQIGRWQLFGQADISL